MKLSKILNELLTPEEKEVVVAHAINGESFRKLEQLGMGSRAKLSRTYKSAIHKLHSDYTFVLCESYCYDGKGAFVDAYPEGNFAIIFDCKTDKPIVPLFEELLGVIVVSESEEVEETKQTSIEEDEAYLSAVAPDPYMNVNYNAIINEGSIVLFLTNGEQYTVNTSNRNFDKIKEMVLNQAPAAEIVYQCSVGKQIESKLNKLRIENGRIWYKDIEIATNMIPRLLCDHTSNQKYVDALENFFERLIENPYQNVISQLFGFLSTNKMPITEDGCFLAFKRVRDDYLDVHSCTINNAVGQKPKIAWAQVDLDPNRTCSSGLHVCSEGYLGSFGGSRIMVCKVDPADVGSVPTDYNNSKMRTRGYEVIGEIGDGFEMSDMACYFHSED